MAYYVFSDNDCKYEGMTKEEIIAAIAEATGVTPSGIDNAFITKIKEQNAGKNLMFWVGSWAEYNALQVIRNDMLYLISDDTEYVPAHAYTHAAGGGDALSPAAIGAAGRSRLVTTTLSAASWQGTEAPFIYTLTVDGVTATSNQEIIPALNITAEQLLEYQTANIQDGGQSRNTIILKAFDGKPSVDIPIRVILRGDA